jgi:hypothetical protein
MRVDGEPTRRLAHCAQGVHHVQHRHHAVLNGNTGVFGLRAFAFDGEPHQARQSR